MKIKEKKSDQLIKKVRDFINQIREIDPVFLIKLQVMAKMGILPTEERVKKMSDLQWILLYLVLFSEEFDKEISMVKFWTKFIKTVLGVETRQGIVPLSVIINPEVLSKLELVEPDEEFNEEDLFTEQADKELQEVFETDIWMFLTEEEKKKIRESNLERIKEEEKILGLEVK